MNVGNNIHNVTQDSDVVEIQLKRVANSILNNLWKIVISVILCGILAFGISKLFITPMYRTTSKFLISNTIADSTPDGIYSGEISASKNVVYLYIEALSSRAIYTAISDKFDLNISYSEWTTSVKSTAVNKAQLLQVMVSNKDPQKAFSIAKAIESYIQEDIQQNTIKGSSAEIWDFAVMPKSPYSPNHLKNTALGLAVGLILSMAIVVLVEISDITIMNDEDIKSCCNYPVLAVIPNMARRTGAGYYYYRRSKYGYYTKKRGYYARENKRNQDGNINEDNSAIKTYVGKRIGFVAIEAYKLLRTKLLYSFSDDKKCHVFCISSALAGEGKSISSVNTAYSFAQLDKRVLLIDCDMRRPTLARKLTLNKYPGLSEYLTGLVELDELLQTYRDANSEDETPVYVITAGNAPPNPVELLNSQKMVDLITNLQERFDYIILDMPPINEVSDALVTPKLADGILLVVHQNYSSRTAIRNAIQQFEFVDAKILGVIFNCVTDRIGGYRQRRYGNRYSDYYNRYNSYQQEETIEQ